MQQLKMNNKRQQEVITPKEAFIPSICIAGESIYCMYIFLMKDRFCM